MNPVRGPEAEREGILRDAGLLDPGGGTDHPEGHVFDPGKIEQHRAAVRPDLPAVHDGKIDRQQIRKQALRNLRLPADALIHHGADQIGAPAQRDIVPFPPGDPGFLQHPADGFPPGLRRRRGKAEAVRRGFHDRHRAPFHRIPALLRVRRQPAQPEKMLRRRAEALLPPPGAHLMERIGSVSDVDQLSAAPDPFRQRRVDFRRGGLQEFVAQDQNPHPLQAAGEPGQAVQLDRPDRQPVLQQRQRQPVELRESHALDEIQPGLPAFPDLPHQRQGFLPVIAFGIVILAQRGVHPALQAFLPQEAVRKDALIQRAVRQKDADAVRPPLKGPFLLIHVSQHLEHRG